MLSALRSWIWSSEKKKKSFEEIKAVYCDQKPSFTVNCRNKVLITGGEEGWENYSYINEIVQEDDKIKDLSKYNYKQIVGEIPQKIKQEIHKLYNNTIKFVDLEESKDKNDFVCPTVKLVPFKNDPIKLRDFLDNDISINYNLSAIILCFPGEGSARGVRLQLYEDKNEQEIRSYRVIGGTYDMDLNWYVEGKECKMKINISDDGSVKILQRNGVTDEEICAHKSVLLGGKELKPRLLSEALGLQKSQAKSSEPISPEYKADETQSKSVIDKKIQCPYPTTLIKDLVEKNHEAKAALKDFASEVKEESSESFKSFKDMIKANVKKADSSIGR